MDALFEAFPVLADIQKLAEQLLAWLGSNVFVLAPLLQLITIGLIFLVVRFLSPRVESLLDHLKAPAGYEKIYQNVIRAIKPLTLPVLWIILQWFSVFAARNAGWPSHLLESAVSLLTAWIIIRLASSLVADPGWSKAIAISAWSLAALDIVGMLDPTLVILDNMAINFGATRVSVLGVGKALVALAVLFWLAGFLSSLVERRINKMAGLTPSVQVLFGKLLKITLYVIAFVLAMNTVGIDLTAFAVFSGAVGLGIGFGLQKVVSNLISGVILLLEKSVKPGDVIAIGETYGWINSLSARYVSVITRDGTEHLIPNEDLISQRVENWSYSNQLIRQRVPIGISYSSDVRKAMELTVEASIGQARVLENPAPVCHLKGFGDNSVDLELRYWLRDPRNGLSNVRNEILLGIWDLFNENGIEFPFPQREIHFNKTIPVKIETEEG
ncbi:MAG: mechanosensitive ion channel [Rhodospirillaceae bacterium]|jgi:small-conductance mechanosensitive channel|nr:mechanosensitive ion channel [Rhodospirillaceae bacterium]MBT5245480.1 mechanosensitive ion channel [Rhodospirillaceae bacterium]MBT5560962.1 mechanosensitive ion channel [Rhodospirillaceae bacterium]MBT6240598.1 mechanosensitive ion channel [Rhodospirillaceae bacterium]MBT7137937.1 mechanosensitive ion channel [Rhodospirillaceae bacterium]